MSSLFYLEDIVQVDERSHDLRTVGAVLQGRLLEYISVHNGEVVFVLKANQNTVQLIIFRNNSFMVERSHGPRTTEFDFQATLRGLKSISVFFSFFRAKTEVVMNFQPTGVLKFQLSLNRSDCIQGVVQNKKL